MYANIKSYVSNDDMMSDFFSSEVGVRQGENLSPILFALFVNDLQNFFELNDCRGIDIYFDASIDLYFRNYDASVCRRHSNFSWNSIRLTTLIELSLWILFFVEIKCK